MGSNKLDRTINNIVKEYFGNTKRPLLEIIDKFKRKEFISGNNNNRRSN